MERNNIIKGWVTSLIGLAVMVLACLDFFGIMQIPAPDGVSKMHQITIAFIIGMALFLIGPGYFEEKLKQIIDKKTNDL